MTFEELGMTFPLWRAPVENAGAEKDALCKHCKLRAPYTFQGVCYACLRADASNEGRDTELGMVRREDAERGLTYGVPLADPAELAGWELVPHEVDPQFPDERWYSVRVARDELLELLRTPEFVTWQGARWLFCCKKACVFLGDWPPALTNVDEVAKAFGMTPDDADDLVGEIEGGHVSTYAFECRVCKRLRAYMDRD